MQEYDNICVVVRCCGERTTHLCIQMLENVFGQSNIFLVESIPFSKAIKDAFEIGIKSKKDWLLCIDADVLIYKDGLLSLIEKAKKTPSHFFQIQGLVADKLFNIIRPAGNHFYRIKYVTKAIDLIPAEGTSLRPESDMLNNMAECGYSWMQCDAIIGIHDYEQYYSDIFRKCFLHSHKHDQFLYLAEKYWSENLDNDLDFKIALWGAFQGKCYSKNIYIDKRFFSAISSNTLKELGFSEKENNLTQEDINVKQIIHNILSSKNNKSQQIIFNITLWNRTIKKRSKNTMFYKLKSKIGKLLIKTGKKLA